MPKNKGYYPKNGAPVANPNPASGMIKEPFPDLNPLPNVGEKPGAMGSGNAHTGISQGGAAPKQSMTTVDGSFRFGTMNGETDPHDGQTIKTPQNPFGDNEIDFDAMTPCKK